jgi:hypothetical protein
MSGLDLQEVVETVDTPDDVGVLDARSLPFPDCFFSSST